MLFRLILLALAGIYYIAYKVHHRFCLRQGKPLEHARLVVVGSFLTGGAGKTPFCAWLARNLHAGTFGKPYRNIAILCHKAAQDEAEMLREKLPFATVVATANRYRTAHELDREYDCILCDDGFEDSRLTGATVVRLDRSVPPRRIRDLVPAGKNRSLEQDHETPAMTLTREDIQFRIVRIVNAVGSPSPADPAVLCGIADPERFLADLTNFGISPSRFTALPDHSQKLEKKLLELVGQGIATVITEKDSARLSEATRKNPLVFVAYQEINVQEQALKGFYYIFNK